MLFNRLKFQRVILVAYRCFRQHLLELESREKPINNKYGQEVRRSLWHPHGNPFKNFNRARVEYKIAPEIRHTSIWSAKHHPMTVVETFVHVFDENSCVCKRLFSCQITQGVDAKVAASRLAFTIEAMLQCVQISTIFLKILIILFYIFCFFLHNIQLIYY